MKLLDFLKKNNVDVDKLEVDVPEETPVPTPTPTPQPEPTPAPTPEPVQTPVVNEPTMADVMKELAEMKAAMAIKPATESLVPPANMPTGGDDNATKVGYIMAQKPADRDESELRRLVNEIGRTKGGI